MSHEEEAFLPGAITEGHLQDPRGLHFGERREVGEGKDRVGLRKWGLLRTVKKILQRGRVERGGRLEDGALIKVPPTTAPFEQELWFHGNIDRAEAEVRLMRAGPRNGAFLVRECEAGETYAISFIARCRLEHRYLTRFRPRGGGPSHFLLNSTHLPNCHNVEDVVWLLRQCDFSLLNREVPHLTIPCIREVQENHYVYV